MVTPSAKARFTVGQRADSLQKMRTDLEEFLSESMKRIDIQNLMHRALTTHGGTLAVGNVSIPLHDKINIVLIAVGKAAIPMCRVAASVLQPALQSHQELRGIAVGPGDPKQLPPFIRHFAGAHPFPDRTSCDAAEAALALVRPLGSSDLVLYLISGGASAMLEAPLHDFVSCEQMAEFYRALVYSGLPITAMNTLRKHMSKVKGGRLAVAASPACQLSLIVSDVPGTAFDVVGSGPSLPDTSTIDECREILSPAGIRQKLGASILRCLDNPALEETPKPTHAAFIRSSCICLLSNDILLQHVKTLAEQRGYYAEIDTTCDDWHYAEAADHLLNRMRVLRRRHDRVCLISGGELSVEVTSGTGLGGRNQHFLLYCASRLSKTDPPLASLSAGTDGVDGNSPAAGAIVDSSTPERMLARGLDPASALQCFDSYSVFNALGDTIMTGPTGNNVRDLRIMLSAD